MAIVALETLASHLIISQMHGTLGTVTVSTPTILRLKVDWRKHSDNERRFRSS